MLELFRGGLEVCVCEVIHCYFPDKYIPVSAENRFPVKHFDDILQQFVFNDRICLNWQNSGIPSAKVQSQKAWSLKTAAEKNIPSSIAGDSFAMFYGYFEYSCSDNKN